MANCPNCFHVIDSTENRPVVKRARIIGCMKCKATKQTKLGRKQ